MLARYTGIFLKGYKNMRAKTLIERTCKVCGKTFLHDNIYFERQFCSIECASIDKRLNRDTRKYIINDNFLKEETNNKYYFLGLMAADGCVFDTSSKSHFHIGLVGEEGLKLIEHLKLVLNCTFPIHTYKNNANNDNHTLPMTSRFLWSDLVLNNITPRKTHTFTIPEYILQDENKLRYFLIGYIDGDGCVGTYHKYTTKKGQGITLDIHLLGSIPMTEQLQLNKHFKKAVFCPHSSSNKVRQICFNGRKAIEFGQWLYDGIDETVFKSYKYYNYRNYMDHRYELTPGLKKRELCEVIQAAITENPLITSKEIKEKYNVSQAYSDHQKYLWRKHNNLSVEQVKEKFGSK